MMVGVTGCTKFAAMLKTKRMAKNRGVRDLAFKYIALFFGSFYGIISSYFDKDKDNRVMLKNETNATAFAVAFTDADGLSAEINQAQIVGRIIQTP